MKYGILISCTIWCVATLVFPARSAAQEAFDVFLIREVVPFGDSGFVAVFLDHPERPRRMRLDFFTADKSASYQRVVSLERQGLAVKYEGAFAWNGTLQVLTSLYYPGPKRNHLIYSQYAIPDLEDIHSAVVDEAYTPELYRIPFGYSLSPDSSKIMCYSWSYSLPKDPARVRITVLDTALNKLWQQQYILPYNNESLYIYNSRLTDDGRAFLLCENYTGKVGPSIDEQKIDYFVLGAEQGSENMIIYDLNPAGKTLHGLHIDPVPGNAMAGAAFYREPGKTLHLGMYLFRIPPAGGKMEQYFLPIDKERYGEAYAFSGTDGMGNANRHRFEGYVVQQVQQLSDSSFLVLAEQEYYSPMEGVLEHNDILAVKVRPEGNRIQWMRRIPKRQTEQFNQNVFSPFSYKLIQQGARWTFFYNDSDYNFQGAAGPQNLDEYRGESGVVMAAELRSDGQLRWYNLSRLLRSKGVAKLWTGHCWDLGTGEVLFFGEGPSPISGKNFLVGFTWDEIRSQPVIQWKK